MPEILAAIHGQIFVIQTTCLIMNYTEFTKRETVYIKYGAIKRKLLIELSSAG